MGVATTAVPYGFWATNPTKKLAHWVYLLGQPLSRNRVFQNFSGEPPLKLSFHIELVSFKNIDIWSINGPKSIKFGVYAKYGHMFIGL